MKSYLNSFAILVGLATTLSSCVIVMDPAPGPDGRPGDAFFGVDYDYAMPYSYWDNNPSIPMNPILGSFYPTGTGVFSFEYFINPYEYWYGTYRIFRNAGGPGGPNGQPGAPGLDTYLMLICNPNGFYEERANAKTELPAPMGETITITRDVGTDRIEIVMTKTTVQARPTDNEPKYLNTQF
ncbi:MAG: hypothetical protein EP314_01825 [Bacteroidetes bacterium]|nr:MAG: hypothetical protein EP314_01825 [Bacteroidota bacterium]